jgi:L-asparaginase
MTSVSSDAMTSAKPSIALISTGGTLDSIGASPLDLAWYAETGQRVSEDQLLARAEDLQDFATVEHVSFRRCPSYALMTADWLDLARTVNTALARADVDGMVITHGTNTLEETAYFLHLVVRPGKPVVLVGAMRPSSALGADGYLNLVRAIQVAGTAEARTHGTLVVLNDTIYSARDVAKTTTYRVNAFQAPDTGPLGYADADGEIVFYHRPHRLPHEHPPFEVCQLTELPRVDVLVSYVGADGTCIDAAVAAGARGLVSAGTGAGIPTPAEQEAYQRARARNVVVCQSTRVGAGRVPSSSRMRRSSIIAGGNLSPWKAKILLSLALTRSNDPNTIQTLFDHW